jgi:UDP-N-acetyl-D-mannosaminuronate dehydrogenase
MEQLKKVEKEYQGPTDRVTFTLDPMDLTKATHFLVSVPTLLLSDKTIDTTYIRSALTSIALYARPGSTVVIESSVAVGMTRRLVGPMAKQRSYFAGMSPEVSGLPEMIIRENSDPMEQRVDPGRTEPAMKAIPKIVSGLDDEVPGSLDAIMKLYSRIFDTVVPVANPETAEMTKLYENCQRMINIAYTNEMADACAAHGIDPFEVCEAAATKPFGYIPFTPGLGVGGHCIPVNPYYLMANNSFPLLQAATEKMWQRPTEIGQRVIDALLKTSVKDTSQNQPSSKKSDSETKVSLGDQDGHLTLSKSEPMLQAPRHRVLVVGVGFKAGQSTISSSPGQQLIQKLADSGVVDVAWADALVEQSAIPHIPRLSMDHWRREELEEFEMIIVAFRQTGMDFGLLKELSKVKIEMWCP